MRRDLSSYPWLAGLIDSRRLAGTLHVADPHLPKICIYSTNLMAPVASYVDGPKVRLFRKVAEHLLAKVLTDPTADVVDRLLRLSIPSSRAGDLIFFCRGINLATLACPGPLIRTSLASTTDFSSCAIVTATGPTSGPWPCFLHHGLVHGPIFKLMASRTESPVKKRGQPVEQEASQKGSYRSEPPLFILRLYFADTFSATSLIPILDFTIFIATVFRDPWAALTYCACRQIAKPPRPSYFSIWYCSPAGSHTGAGGDVEPVLFAVLNVCWTLAQAEGLAALEQGVFRFLKVEQLKIQALLACGCSDATCCDQMLLVCCIPNEELARRLDLEVRATNHYAVPATRVFIRIYGSVFSSAVLARGTFARSCDLKYNIPYRAVFGEQKGGLPWSFLVFPTLSNFFKTGCPNFHLLDSHNLRLMPELVADIEPNKHRKEDISNHEL
ncbi:uncharacterized protein BDR25DRAFT_352043 [Lindgomyces ingoldianus]|uniref:Uncharacterized protein n=1 Tax=Lindgomyces ingoldianus TaxID=673940 RepID=A0ACB6R4U7_9PLEO|nr:uncharacterized protein BDR25DRAFT_352043 [Lindgomyces ingoldianus]KAF2473547.1 hypothetical protein BDR25DRAFT_352043 [Lindgomyces ingoldianus]